MTTFDYILSPVVTVINTGIHPLITDFDLKFNLRQTDTF